MVVSAVETRAKTTATIWEDAIATRMRTVAKMKMKTVTKMSTMAKVSIPGEENNLLGEGSSLLGEGSNLPGEEKATITEVKAEVAVMDTAAKVKVMDTAITWYADLLFQSRSTAVEEVAEAV